MKCEPIHPVVLEVYDDIIAKIAPSESMFADYLRKNFSELVHSDSAEVIWHSGDYLRYIRYSVKVLKDVESCKAEYFYNYIIREIIMKSKPERS